MKILIAGDFYVNENSKFYIDELFDELNMSDYFLFNLEAPIRDKKSIQAILKGGPNLYMNTSSLTPFVEYYKKIILSGANNHMGDFGEEGVLSTLKFFKDNNILNIGCGENIDDAGKPLFLDDNTVILAIAENEFGMASEFKAGSNPLKIEKNLIEIMKLNKHGYTVIVYFHGGTEEFPLPNPFIKRLFRTFLDAGGKVVIGNHPHIPQGYEVYNNGYIFYSLGNFIFDKREMKHTLKSRLKSMVRGVRKNKVEVIRDFWNIGYLVSLNLDKNQIDFEIIPVTYDKNRVTVMKGEQKKNFLGYLNKLVEINNNKENYLTYWNSWTKLQSNFIKRRISDFSYFNINSKYKNFLSFRNQITCESHRELLLNLNFLIENKELERCADTSIIKLLQNPDNFNI